MIQPLDLKEKLNHLINLWDDESPEMRKILREELLKHGLEIVLQQDSCLQALGGEERRRFQELLKELHFDLVLAAFSQILNHSLDEIDLEKSMLVISYWDRPEIPGQTLRGLLDKLADEVSREMPGRGHPLSFIDHINRVLFQTYHFRGNSGDYYNPDNSYLHKVLETGLGIPISLSIIYMLVCKRLNFPVYGVCMPAHFIVKFDNGEDEIFFDPFYGGKVYSRQNCLEYLQGVKAENPDEILKGCSTLDIVKRVLRNLHLNYASHTPAPEKVLEIEQMLAVLETFEQ
ncbi:MAG: hypothetical protein HUU32_10775 [Calditrichaceae bacterium]|nr:hypothetical protein [Calditrichaceae bacterium]